MHEPAVRHIGCYRGDGMAYAVIGQNETPEQLAARVGRPLCMLLRANRLYSEAWLLPGREIIVPQVDFCQKDAGVCPLRALEIPAERFAERSPAEQLEIPARLRMWSDAHGRAMLPEWRAGGRMLTIRPCETMAQFAVRAGRSEAEIRRINRYYGRPVPGMQLLSPIDA